MQVVKKNLILHPRYRYAQKWTRRGNFLLFLFCTTIVCIIGEYQPKEIVRIAPLQSR